MNMEQFTEQVVSHILEYLPEEYREARAEVMERTKNNDTLVHGLIIRREPEQETETAPIVYLEAYFNEYRFGGKDMEDVMHEIARDYREALRNIPALDLPEMTKEGIKDKVCVRLVNTATNGERLKELVGLPMDSGFSLTVYIDMDVPSKNAMIQITKEMAERMGYDEREMLRDAMCNTVKAHPAQLVEMQKIMMDIGGIRNLEAEDNLLSEDAAPAGDISMLILTVEDKYFGAAALFYPEIQGRIADITRLEACDHVAIPVNDELGEVPLDIRLFGPVWIGFGEHLFQKRLVLVLTEPFKALLGLQIGVERQLVLTVHFRFLHLREGGVEVHGAELMDLLVRAGSLPAELVAGNVQNLQAFVVVIAVQLFNGGILRREAAARGRVDHQDDLAPVVGQVKLFSLAGDDCIIVNHFTLSFLGLFYRFHSNSISEKCPALRSLFS